MSSALVRRIFVGGFVALFFAYLFGPLAIMSVTAFNSSEFPRVTPWDCFTTEWFSVLAGDQRLMEGLRNSLIIGFGVVILAVPLGLAGALLLTQVGQRTRSFLYTVLISPILVPGVVLGISTLIFWDRLGTMLDAGYKSVFYDGIFLTVIGQSTFIAAYCMLVFIARLQRFDPALEEAALDLGASHTQTFRKVLLPFLRPAMFSAAVLAFLASFENYNTTVFTIVSESTLTTVLASKVRYGINPSISALAVVIVALTLVGAIVHEFLQRREALIEGGGSRQSATLGKLFGDPAILILLAIFVAGLGTVFIGSRGDTAACKARVLEERRSQQHILTPAPAPTTPATPPAQGQGGSTQSGPQPYGSIFSPGNLTSPPEEKEQPEGEGSEGGAGKATPQPYGNIFSPGNLTSPGNGGASSGSDASGSESSGDGETAPEKPAEPYGNIFNPGNLPAPTKQN